jgi:hypothetical protein
VLIVEGNYRRRDTSHDRYRVFDIDGMGDIVKRQIICNECRMDQGQIKSYDGEWFKTVSGKAKARPMMCDSCGKAILPNENVHAQSFGLDRHPYHEWETQYIEVTP